MNNVLLVSIAYLPNVGGIETHFADLVKALVKRGHKVRVLTYKPITTRVSAPFYERDSDGVIIYRIPWIGGLFFTLKNLPLIEFLYLLPGLFITLPILLFKAREIDVIHSHGLIAGFVSVFWGKMFGKRVLTTTHSIYHFPEKGVYKQFARWVFNRSDLVLTLSKQSKSEIVKLGISKSKVRVFTYWIDLGNFKKIANAKKKVGWENKFVVIFVGRLLEEKGVHVLLKSVKTWNKNIVLAIAGTGPLEKKITNLKSQILNLYYLGRVEQEKLPLYYSAADLAIVPSTHEEGFGRVILESLACGTPVIGSKRGAIPEAMDNTVGKLIDINSENIEKTVNYYFQNLDELKKKSKVARVFAEKHYSERNTEVIINSYNK